MSDKIVKFITTFGFIGYLPLAPGSMASIAGGWITLYLAHSLPIYFVVWLIITILGFIASDRMETIVGKKDPGCIVIDEVSGIMIAFFMLPVVPSVLITAFFLFRAFDMFKIYPANKMESLKGGVGVMMDDIIAGVYTSVVMHLALKFISIPR
jgi:phosphatidylglycerophosphatase A